MPNEKLVPVSAIVCSFFSLCLFASCGHISAREADPLPLKLWYDQPAADWNEALPVGNGRLGAMVFGRIGLERIQVNEESLWGGSNVNNNNPGASENLPEIRRLILDGDIPKAKILAEEHLLGDPWVDNSYRTLGDIFIDFGHDDTTAVTAYHRELDLRKGVASVSYETPQGVYAYEMFSSAPDDVMVLHMTTTAPDGFQNTTIALTRVEHTFVDAMSGGLTMIGRIIDDEASGHGPAGAHMRFASRLEVSGYDGILTQNSNTLVLNGGHSATLLFSAATNYDLPSMDFDRGIDPHQRSMDLVAKASEYSYQELKSRHVDDHLPIMDRVTIDLGGHERDSIPTGRRLSELQQGASDPALKALYFQFGRYLLMGSSRAPGVLPANLQGIWNEHIWAPWGSDYHVNINIQMNYWPANVTNLDETVSPLGDFMSAITVPGAVTARDMYGAGGWAMHHTTDVFGKTGVMDGIHWGMFPLGGAWMMFPLYRHYEYTLDTDWLLNRAYPVMRGSAEFILDFLVEDDEGRLVTVPSYSPENSYILPETGEEYRITYGPTMDIQIIRELFGYILDVADNTGEEDAFLDRLRSALERLPEVRIGANGTIMEWIEDYDEAEPGHRHISHLLGLHPGTHITRDTPEMFEAARRTIERRFEHGGGHTGWSMAWIINFYARLLDAEAAHHHFRLLLEQSTLPNLFDTHPPFQIDGNFGGTAAVAEMLLQSHLGYIQLLPALPEAWSTGRVTGLKARGNFEIDIAWEEQQLTEVRVISHSGRPLTLEYNGQRVEQETTTGEILIFGPGLR
ncbi:glycoside hydrolase family 95 protein [Balneolales bacterium ANBcel1]|nr:glycoside hydrolase family 95 protein [Balneolales bacterium ANBcel1]